MTASSKPTPEEAFRRWRRTQEPDALGDVFDALAPGLLRLAVHWVGRADEAEDLVQASFLALIERPEGFDPERGALAAWLAGILARKARAARRSGARAPEVERLVTRAVETPLDAAVEAERSGALAEAVDQVEEPYRAALVLRLRHGLSPAEVAHALGISPGAARTRLSRGTERLRRRLPEGVAPGLLLAPDLTLGRGLNAVRESVLGHAAATAAVTGASTLTVGGLLMTQKILAAGACALALIAAVALARFAREEPAAREASQPRASVAEVADIAPAALESGPAAAAPTRSRRELEAEVGAEVSDDLVALRGRVLDAETGAPVAGASLRFVAAVRLKPSEVLRRSDGTVRQQLYNGCLMPFGALPAVDGDLHVLGSQLDTVTPRFFVAPDSADLAAPLAEAESRADGSFEMRVPSEGGTLWCGHADYPARALPVRLSSEATSDSDEPGPPVELWLVELRRARTFQGTVVDQRTGEPIDEPLDLILWGDLQRAELREPTAARNGRVARAARTGPGGWFELPLPLESAQVEVRTPGWVPAGGTQVLANTPAQVLLRPAPFLRVTDASSGAPVPAVRLLALPDDDAQPIRAVQLTSPAGRYPIADRYYDLSALEKPVRLHVWADGFDPVRLEYDDLSTQHEIALELQPGAPPRIAGRVLFAEEPAEDAQVLLQVVHPAQWDTGLDFARSIEGARTDESGYFAFGAAPGSYVLRVAYADRVYAEPIELEADGRELVIDLARLGSVAVTVRDADGLLQADHTVVLRSPAGRSEWRWTDSDGVVVFDSLGAGEFELHVPNVSTRTSFGGGVREPVSVVDGEIARVTVTVPSGKPRFARLIPGEGDLPEAFHVRPVEFDEEWVRVEPDGRVPLDLAQLVFPHIEFAHEDGRRFEVRIPSDAPDGHPIEFRHGGAVLEGRVVDRETGAGIPGVWIQGFAGGTGWKARVRADEEGNFRLPFAGRGQLRLTFSGGAPGRADRLDFSSLRRELGGLSFVMEGLPTPGELIEVRLPREISSLPTKPIAGVLRREDGGAPVPEATIWMRGIEDQAFGRLEALLLSGRATTDAEGAFDLRAPDLNRLVANVYPDGNSAGVTLEIGPEEPASGLELTVP